MKILLIWFIGLHALLLTTSVVAVPYYWVNTSSGNWSDAGNWSFTSGGIGGAGIPGPGDEAIFDAQGLGVCKLDANITLETLTLTSGYSSTLEFEAFTVTTTHWFADQATLNNGVLSIAGGSANVNNSNVNVELNGTGANAIVVTTVFSMPVALTLNGVLNSQFTSSQFQSTVGLTRQGTGDLVLQSNQFNSPTEFINDNNTGLISSEGTEIYSGTLTLINLATSSINMNFTGTATFNNQVNLENTTSGTIRFGAGGGLSTVTFPSGTIEFTNSGMGTYDFNNMTVNGSFDNFSLPLTGSSILSFTQCTFSNNIDLIVAQIVCGSGNQFNQLAIQVTGTGPSTLSGTFQQTAMIDHPGTGTLTLQNNTFNNFANLTNWLGGGPIIAQGTEVYNSNFYVTNQSTEPIDLAYTGTATYNSQVTLHNGNTGAIRFGEGGGLSEFAIGGVVGFNDSGMGIYSFTGAAVNGTFGLSGTDLTGSSVLHLEQCTFNNMFSLYLDVAQITCGPGNQFNSPNAGFIVTGSGPSTLSGTFQQTVMMDHPGTGTLTLQNNTFNNFANLTNWFGGGPIITQGTEVYNSNFYVTNQSTEPIDLAYTGTATYNSQVTLHNGNTGAIRFGEGGGLSEFAIGGVVGFNDSGMGIYSFTGATVNGTFGLSGTDLTGSSVLHLEQCTFNNMFSLYLDVAQITCGPGNQFNSVAGFIITGSGPSTLSGTFQQTAMIDHPGTGTLTLQNNTFNNFANLTNWLGGGPIITQGTEVYNSNFYVTNQSTEPIDLAYTGTATYNSQVTLHNGNTGAIRFGEGGGISEFAIGGVVGFNDSGMGIYSFTGATVNGTFGLSGTDLTGSSVLHLEQCTFSNMVSLYLDVAQITCGPGNQFNSVAGFIITGSGPSTLSGTFQQTAMIDHPGTGTLTLQNNTFNNFANLTNWLGGGPIITQGSEVYNSNFYVNNQSTEPIDLAYSGTATYNSQVTLHNGNTGAIRFGEGGGLSTLTAGATLAINDSGLGLYSLEKFTQEGSAPINLTLTGTAQLGLQQCEFDAPVTITSSSSHASSLTFTQNIFHATVDLDYTGSGNGTAGENVFEDDATVTMNGTGSFSLGAGTGDTYQQTATFTRVQGTLQPCLSSTCKFESDLTLHAGNGSQLVVGSSAAQGIVIFNGSNPSYTATGTLLPQLHAVQVNLASGALQLTGTLNILSELTFAAGTIASSPTHPVRILNAATISGANGSRFVNGPVSKVGNQAFTFPIGAGSIYRPIAISAPTDATDEFTARFFNTSQGYGTSATYMAPLVAVSMCEYWMLDRTAGNAAVFVTVSWTSADCAGSYVADPSTLSVARWDGTNWIGHGQSGYTGTAAAGTVTSQNAIASFSPIALGSTSLSNPLPIELITFTGHSRQRDVLLQWESLTEVNSDYYDVQRSEDGIEFELLARVRAAGSSVSKLSYSHIDDKPLPLAYYRLKMVDLDGTTTYSHIVRVDKVSAFDVYPNPVRETIFLTSARRIRLYSITGTLVFDSVETVSTIGVNTLAAGLYWMVTDKGERKKVVIAR